MNTLEKYLESKKITKFDFANSVGVTRQSIYKWLKGGAMPTPCNIRAIHAAYPDIDIMGVVRDIVAIILQT